MAARAAKPPGIVRSRAPPVMGAPVTITPPVGIDLFAVMNAAGSRATFKHVYLGVAPFIVLDIIVPGPLIAVPEIAAWLPRRMMEG